MREAHAYRGRVGAHQSALTAPTDFLLGDWIVDQSVMDKMCVFFQQLDHRSCILVAGCICVPYTLTGLFL